MSPQVDLLVCDAAEPSPLVCDTTTHISLFDATILIDVQKVLNLELSMNSDSCTI